MAAFLRLSFKKTITCPLRLGPILQRPIMTSPFRAEQAIEELKQNPFFDKYSQKIATLQRFVILSYKIIQCCVLLFIFADAHGLVPYPFVIGYYPKLRLGPLLSGNPLLFHCTVHTNFVQLTIIFVTLHVNCS